MHVGFFKNIEEYLTKEDNKKILVLNDSYFSYNPTNQNSIIIDYIDSLENRKNINIVEKTETFFQLKNDYDIIINIFFSSIFINQLSFYNQILKISKLETQFVNILPFLGFINYSYLNFNPNLFNFINVNKNFRLEEISFLDRYGKKLQIKDNFVDKVFYQTTEKRNQSFVDHLYNQILSNFTDMAILFDLKINKLEKIDYDFYDPVRLGHHLSGHSSKTWVDEGAYKKILEIIKVRTMIDVGCGPGGMVKYSKSLGIKAVGVDGDDSIIREIGNNFYLHDYTSGPLKIKLNFDLCWCVEFLEHVEKIYTNNYFDTFKKCRYVFCTFAPLGKGGYHHVNTQDQNYWIETFKKFDFKFEEEKTKSIRQSSTINKNFVREHGLLFKNNNKNI